MGGESNETAALREGFALAMQLLTLGRDGVADYDAKLEWLEEMARRYVEW